MAVIITRRVALVDPEKLDLGLLVFIQIKTAQHSVECTEQLVKTAQGIAQIIGLYRMLGDLDYLIKARARDISDYDRLYQLLIKGPPLMDVTASFVTESLKDTAKVLVFILIFGNKNGGARPPVSPFRLIVVTAPKNFLPVA